MRELDDRWIHGSAAPKAKILPRPRLYLGRQLSHRRRQATRERRERQWWPLRKRRSQRLGLMSKENLVWERLRFASTCEENRVAEGDKVNVGQGEGRELWWQKFANRPDKVSPLWFAERSPAWLLHPRSVCRATNRPSFHIVISPLRMDKTAPGESTRFLCTEANEVVLPPYMQSVRALSHMLICTPQAAARNGRAIDELNAWVWLRSSSAFVHGRADVGGSHNLCQAWFGRSGTRLG